MSKFRVNEDKAAKKTTETPIAIHEEYYDKVTGQYIFKSTPKPKSDDKNKKKNT